MLLMISLLFQLHGKSDFLFIFVNIYDLYFYRISYGHYVHRMFDEFVTQLGNMNEAVVLYAYVYEGAEIHHISYGTFQFHPHFQVVEGSDIVAEDHRRRIFTGLSLIHI